LLPSRLLQVQPLYENFAEHCPALDDWLQVSSMTQHFLMLWLFDFSHGASQYGGAADQPDVQGVS
jgi:hypothetical protein